QQRTRPAHAGDGALVASGPAGRTARSQRQLPRLGNEAGAPEAVVTFAGRPLETGLLVETARGLELALGPQRDLAVAAAAGKPDTLVDEPRTNALAARRGLDQQQAQLGNGVGFPDQENRTDDLPIHLRNPAAL